MNESRGGFGVVGRRSAALVAIALAAGLSSCGGDDVAEERAALGWVADVERAVAAVEAERGEGQDYFEVTSTPQLTNVFVAVDGATAAVPYVYVDGVLRAPAPRLDDASGQTFTAAAIDFDEANILTSVAQDLPDVTILALSVEGGPADTVRYVISAQSSEGGALDIEVTRTGAVVAVDPL